MNEPLFREREHVGDEDLVRLTAGELPPDREAAVAAHLESCAGCRKSLQEIRRAFEGYAEARRAELEPRMSSIAAPRAELQRRLAAARIGRKSWFGWLDSFPGRAYGALGLATLLLVTAIAALSLRFAPSAEGPLAEAARVGFAPDPRLTPGLADAVPAAELCAAEPERRTAPIDRALALEVFRSYGIADPEPRAYEVDYVIPPELGGATDLRNLWPQPYDVQPWNAHAKDALEDHLLRSVCEGGLELSTAQRELSEGWIAAYQRRFRTQEPLVEHASFLKDEPWQ